MTKLLAYHWSARQSIEWLRDQVDASLETALAQGFDELAERPARVPRRLLGARRHRARRRPRDPAGAALRPVPPAAGLRAGRDARHRGQGPDRPRLRRPRLLGHRGVRAAGADPHAARGGPRRAALAPSDPARWPGARAQQLRLAGRGDAVAHDPRRGVLGLLAGGHGRRSTSTPTSPGRSSATWRPPATRTSSATTGVELLVESARLWAHLGHHGDDERFHIHGVTGPDEYSALVDDNVYTNLMARANLRRGGGRGERHRREAAEQLGVPPEEIDRLAGARPTRCTFPSTSGWGPPPGPGLPRPRRVGLRATRRPSHYPLLLHYPYFELYRKQVVKQADLVLALHLCGDALHPRAEAARLRLLRDADGARLVAVGVHPVGRRRRGRATSSSPTTTWPRRR